MADADPEEFDVRTGAFVVLLDDGQAVAGGGIRRVDSDTCEVKRVWTSPGHRRQGHARTVLTALEGAARDRGYTRVRLETGPAQPEAVALSQDLGYRQIPLYGRYQAAVAFERRLGPIEHRSASDR